LLAGHHDLGLLHSGAVSWQDCYQSALQALDELAQECERIFVLGSSFGGSLAYILAAKEPDKLAGLIAVSAPAQSSERWLPAEPWAQQVRAAIEAADQHLTQIYLPSLILHGQDDPSVKLRHALHAFGQIPAMRKKLTLYDGIGHSVGFGFNTPEVAEDVQQFIQATLPVRRVRFAIADQAYRQVALAGDFNNWTAQALHRQDEEWLGELELLPGIYQYKLVIDGLHWILDPEAETLAAPHGQVNSLLRI
jgi:esterase/lipase